MIVPEAQVQRHRIYRPLVLDIQGDRTNPVLPINRQRMLDNSERSPSECLVRETLLDVLIVEVVAFEPLLAHLEVMRPGDVGDREPLVEIVLLDVLPIPGPTAIEEAPVRVNKGAQALDAGGIGKPILTDEVVNEVAIRDTRFNQQRVRRRVGPRGHRLLRRPELHLGRRGGRREVAEQKETLAAVLDVIVEVELVSLGSLPRDAHAEVCGVRVDKGATAHIGLVDKRAGALAVEGARLVLLRAPVPKRTIEPHPIRHNRPADPDTIVKDALHRLARSDPRILNLLGQVVGLQILPGAGSQEGKAKLVRPVFRHVVDGHPGGFRFPRRRWRST